MHGSYTRLQLEAASHSAYQASVVGAAQREIDRLNARIKKLEAELLKAQQATTAAEVVGEAMLEDCRRQATGSAAGSNEVRTLQAALRRKDREWAKPVAAEYGIEIERVGTGFYVWPPKALFDQGKSDLYVCDHYAGNWSEVAVMVKDYAHQLGSTK